MTARLSRREIDVLAVGRDVPPRAWVIDGLLHTETLRPHSEVLAAAVTELRDAEFSPRECDVIRGIHSRLEGEERDLLERVLDIVAPRTRP